MNKLLIHKFKISKNFKSFVGNLIKSSFGKNYIFVYKDNNELVSFYPLTFNSARYEHINRLKKWRQKSKKVFSSNNKITYKSTKKYLQKYLNSQKLRIIFYIKYKRVSIGHFELTNLTSNNKQIEITYVLRGNRKYKGKMSQAICAISKFLIIKYKFVNIIIKVKKNNLKAINFYRNNNFFLHKELDEILVFKFNKKRIDKKIKFRIIK